MAGQKMRPAFYRLHAATLNPATTRDQLADALRAAEAVQDRHRLSEGAVYASAQRRWLLDTGTDWITPQSGDTTWGGQSSHRLRTHPPEFDGTTLWECSCGLGPRAADTQTAAETAHADHVTHASGQVTA